MLDIYPAATQLQLPIHTIQQSALHLQIFYGHRNLRHRSSTGACHIKLCIQRAAEPRFKAGSLCKGTHIHRLQGCVQPDIAIKVHRALQAEPALFPLAAAEIIDKNFPVVQHGIHCHVIQGIPAQGAICNKGIQLHLRLAQGTAKHGIAG